MASRTHYDNLQVSRTAPPEVIAAAYRTLCAKYHPDKNPDDPRCEQIIRTLNRSYEVLSDLQQRASHDHWIVEQERSTDRASNSGQTNAGQRQRSGRPPNDFAARPGSEKSGPHWGWLGAIGLGGLWMVYAASTSDQTEVPPSNLRAYEAAALKTDMDSNSDSSAGAVEAPAATTPPSASAVEAPGGVPRDLLTAPGTINPGLLARTPDGTAWPKIAAYLPGTKRLAMGGRSRVTIDNTRNASDVHVKLVEISATRTRPVRELFIPAHSDFTVSQVDPGTYDVRYRDLSDGGLSRSESFTLSETRESDGVRYDNITMTLFKVTDGNMQTYALAPSEF